MAAKGAGSLGKKHVGVASSILISKIITIILTGASFIVVARLLGPSTYGIYTLALAFAGIFYPFSDMGISVAILKLMTEYISTKKTALLHRTLANGYTLLLISGAIFTVLMIAISGFAAVHLFNNPSATLALQIAALTIIASAIYNFSYSILIALGAGGDLTKTVAVQAFVQMSVSIGLALIGFGALAPIIGLLASTVIGLFVALAIISKASGFSIFKLGISFSESKSILKFSVPIGLSSVVSGVIQNISLVVLGVYATAAIVGNFGVTFKVVNIFDLMIGSIALALFPLFTSVLSGKKAKYIGGYYNSTLYLTFLLLAPIVFYIVVLAVPFSYTVFGATYSYAPVYIAVMSIGILMTIVYMYTNNLIVSAGKSLKIFKYSVVLAIVQAILLFLIVPKYNGLGLAFIMFIIMPTLTGAVFVRRVQMMFKARLGVGRLLMVSGIALVSALLILPLEFVLGQGIPILIAAVIEQFLLYPFLLAVLKGINHDDISTIRRITTGLPVIDTVASILADYTSLFLR